MTIEFTPIHRHPDALAKCDDCGHVCRCGDLNPIKDPGERLDDGSPLPSGECPKCGSLSYRQHGGDIWGCSNCGCTDAESSAWIHCNTRIEADGDGPAYHDWCPQCSDDQDDGECHIVRVDKLKPYVRPAE